MAQYFAITGHQQGEFYTQTGRRFYDLNWYTCLPESKGTGEWLCDYCWKRQAT